MKRGLLLVNLGTPQSPRPADVGRYLREFLMDEWVLNLPRFARWVLVNVLIVPRRKYASAEAYEKVWTERGSPLLVNLRDLQAEVTRLGAGLGMQVAVGMRYGQPSIRAGLAELSDCQDILVMPLYPQYAESSMRSSVEEAERQAVALGLSGKVRFVPAFYDDPGFLDAFAESARERLAGGDFDHVLFSFHGLPESHVRATDRSPPGARHCLATPDCCERICDANRDCYRAQSFSTARALAARLGLSPGAWSVSFQSRLGRQPWIKPYTDFVYRELPLKGVRRLVVVCPSFAADCLETLEEIRIRGSADFRAAGGESLVTADCLNARPTWARAVAAIASRHFERGA